MRSAGWFRRSIVLAAILVSVGMALYPPWIHTARMPEEPRRERLTEPPRRDDAGDAAKAGRQEEKRTSTEAQVQEAAGGEIHFGGTYRLFFSPPPPPKDWPLPRGALWSVNLDYGRLLLQYGLLVAICVALIWAFSGREEHREDDEE